jgi:hypothetical protein
MCILLSERSPSATVSYFIIPTTQHPQKTKLQKEQKDQYQRLVRGCGLQILEVSGIFKTMKLFCVIPVMTLYEMKSSVTGIKGELNITRVLGQRCNSEGSNM